MGFFTQAQQERQARIQVFKHGWKEYGLTFKDGDRKGQPVPYFRLYDLRHTFLTRLGEEGVSETERTNAHCGLVFDANGFDVCASIEAMIVASNRKARSGACRGLVKPYRITDTKISQGEPK